MSVKQPFKTYARTTRIQETNVTFANGMSFTDAALAEGFSRLLINFDFGVDGVTLRPRKGFRTTGDGLCVYLGNKLTMQSGMSIVAGNKVTHHGHEYYQLIIGKIDLQTDYGLYTGDAWVVTYDGIGLKWFPLNNAAFYKCYFTKPDITQASIHGIPLEESSYIKKHVGVFAFNGEYYYFTSDGKLRHTVFNELNQQYETAVITPIQITQSEAQNSLYNMLLEDPYSFICEAYGGSIFKMTGFAPHEFNRFTNSIGELKIRPNMGEEYYYKMYFNYPTSMLGTKLYFHIEYNTGANDAWHTIARDENRAYTIEANENSTGAKPFIFENIRVDAKFAQFRVYAVKEADAAFNNSNQLTDLALSKGTVLTASFNYIGKDVTDGTTNINLRYYDLSFASGMVYWKNRIFLFGAKDKKDDRIDNTLLIASDPNRPDWFPYTANADIFDEEIVRLQPMLDELLVFTAHNLYSLTLSTDGLSWTKKHLQSNLNINAWDLNLIQTVKNMVFFKSGNYYYMVVPKLSATTGAGLAIAPITKPIASLLDNFAANVNQIVDDVYNYSLYSRYRDEAKTTFSLRLVHYYNYLDYEDVHNTYLFELVKHTKVAFNLESGTYTYEDSRPVLLNFSLIYNTVSRTWRIYMLESERMIQPLFLNATGRGVYTGLVENDGAACLQFLEYDDTINHDAYIRQNNGKEVQRADIIKNWQYLDSGNLEQNSDMKKRFREYQFKINNLSNSVLEFYSGFFIDKLTRTYEIQYNEEEIEDDSEDVATVVIDAIPKYAVANESTDVSWTTLGSWELNKSKFPNVNIWKIRIPTSGKGYLPRVVLISYNETDFELLSFSTVYRQLYSR